MAKTLNELASDLKQFIIEEQSDAHNSGGVRKERYNNMKLLMEPERNKNSHVVICFTMSSAEYLLPSGQKIEGGLGPEERYVTKWLGKSETMTNLQETWKEITKSRGRA